MTFLYQIFIFENVFECDKNKGEIIFWEQDVVMLGSSDVVVFGNYLADLNKDKFGELLIILISKNI